MVYASFLKLAIVYFLLLLLLLLLHFLFSLSFHPYWKVRTERIRSLRPSFIIFFWVKKVSLIKFGSMPFEASWIPAEKTLRPTYLNIGWKMTHWIWNQSSHFLEHCTSTNQKLIDTFLNRNDVTYICMCSKFLKEIGY